jgi:glycosyltransferase involved in cell wall biosynthesis
MSYTPTISDINGCVIIPTYNNERTLERVINSVMEIIPKERIIVINDGATDSTSEILAKFETDIIVLKNDPNRGKGFSLRKGFKKAIELGFENALTFDSDGQHYPSDIPKMIQAAYENKGAVIMGSRNMSQEGVPNKSSFGNKFSNFWFKLETWITLPDTQTGFRIYPLKPLKKMRLFTTKFELEIEVIVRLAWKFVRFIPVSIQVKYDPEERVSHFRPGRDFFRISVLNSVLVLGALFYYYPKKLFSKDTFAKIKHEAIKPEESNLSKSLSISFGVFMGIFPIWGFQLLVGIPLAVLFRLNKVLFITAANISIPPMIPFIIYLSLLTGSYFGFGSVEFSKFLDFSSDAVQQNLKQYFIGAILLSCFAFAAVFVVSFGVLSVFRKSPVRSK